MDVCIQNFLQYIRLASTKSGYWVVYILFYIFFCLLQKMLDMHAHAIVHEFIYMDDVGLISTKAEEGGEM